MAKQQDVTKKDLDPRIKAIAKKLETIRIQKGYSSYENFAIEFGISRMQYWRMEKGTNFKGKKKKEAFSFITVQQP